MTAPAVLLPLLFWGSLSTLFLIVGYMAGAARAYRHGFEDGVELAASDMGDNFGHIGAEGADEGPSKEVL